MATLSSILAWRIPWTEEPGGLQSTVLQRVRQDWNNLAHTDSRLDKSYLREAERTKALLVLCHFGFGVPTPVLEKEMATHSSILAWRIPWTEEPGRLQSMGSQRIRHDWGTSLHFTSLQCYTSDPVVQGHCFLLPWASLHCHPPRQIDQIEALVFLFQELGNPSTLSWFGFSQSTVTRFYCTYSLAGTPWLSTSCSLYALSLEPHAHHTLLGPDLYMEFVHQGEGGATGMSNCIT